MLILPCCGGVTAVGALTGDTPEATTGTDNRLADIQPITTTSAPAPASAPTSASASASASSAVPSAATTTTITKKTVKIAYRTKRVDDDTLAEGKTRVRTKGVNGVKTITYEVTYSGGRPTTRRVVSTVVTKRPVTRVIAVGTKTSSCDPNYTPCVPIASDVDCAGGSGNGPAYVDGPIEIIGNDPYDLDRDGDGIACDS